MKITESLVRHAPIIGIMLLTAGLRIYQIDLNDVWLDEANTILISGRDLAGLMKGVSLDGSPPLYYLTLHYWMVLFGQSEIAVRSLAAVYGTLLVGAVYWVGSSLFSRQTGFMAALVCAIAPIQVMYSQQARMYSLLPLVSLLAMFFALKYLREGGPLNAFGYGAFTLLSTYTHHYGLLILPAQALTLLLFGSWQRRAAISALIVLGAALRWEQWWPRLMEFYSMSSTSAPRGHRMRFWEQHGFGGSLFKTLESFAPGGSVPPYVPLDSLGFLAPLPVVGCAVILGVSIWVLIRPGLVTDGPKRAIFWLWIYVVIPLLAAGLYSQLVSPVYLAGRCDQVVFPAFCLLIGIGLTFMPSRALRVGAITIVAACSLLSLHAYYETNNTTGDRLLAEAIRNELRPGDAILCTSLTRAPLEYHLRDTMHEITFYSYPPQVAAHMAWSNEHEYLKDPEGLARQARAAAAEIAKGKGRLFLVYVNKPVNRPLRDHFEGQLAHYDVRRVGVFRQSLLNVPVLVLLLTPQPIPSP